MNVLVNNVHVYTDTYVIPNYIVHEYIITYTLLNDVYNYEIKN